MDDNKHAAQQLLKKYLSAEANAEEIEQVENWYDAFEKNAVPDQERKDYLGEQMRIRLQRHMHPKVLFMNRTSFLRIAAAVLMICAIGISYRKLARQPEQIHSQLPQLTFNTGAGEKKTLVLSDGSEIKLSQMTRITYPLKFAANSREITLVEGEAFFKVAHEAKRPFKVNMPDKIYTQVLGTSFQIRAYKVKGELNVAVSTGKVAVGNKHQVFGTLIKGEQITYNRAAQSAIISQIPVADTKIVFEGINLKQALQELEYIYTIKIELQPAQLGTLGCTATFNSRQEPEEILGVICSLYNLRFTMSPDHKSFKIHKI